MAARIHINRNAHGEVELWLNEEGRDLLVKELGRLGPEHEHFHLGPSGDQPEVPLQTVPYRPDDEVFAWGKVLFRLDEWDAQYFPHVLEVGKDGEGGEPVRAGDHFQEGMDTFVVQFRKEGTSLASVCGLGLDEKDAVKRAVSTFDQSPESDPRTGGADLEVRVGRIVSETVFSSDWQPLKHFA